MANSKMVRFAFCCIVFSILGAIANAGGFTGMITKRPKSSGLRSEPAPNNHMDNTVSETITKNYLPANVDQSIGQSRSNLRSQGAPLFPSVLDDIDLENGPTALDDLSSILGLPKQKPKPMKVVSPKKANKIDYSSSDDLAARIAGVPSSSLSGESSQSNQVDVKNDEHDPLDDKVVEFISCWDSVPSDIKETLSAKELVDFKTFAKYVLGLRSRAPSSYSSLDAISAHNFAMNSNFLIEKCRNLGGEKVAQNDKVEDDIHDPLDDKIAEFLSCWDSVPSAVKQGLSDQKQSDFKKFSEYVRDLHLRAPSSYYSLDVSQAHHLALESNFFLGECMNLDKNESDLIVEDGEYETLDKKIVEFLTCWNDLPAEYKNTMPAFKLSNHDTMAKYVEKIHSQIISKEKLDKSAVDNLEWGMSVHIDKCHELEAHRILNLSADF